MSMYRFNCKTSMIKSEIYYIYIHDYRECHGGFIALIGVLRVCKLASCLNYTTTFLELELYIIHFIDYNYASNYNVSCPWICLWLYMHL